MIRIPGTIKIEFQNSHLKILCAPSSGNSCINNNVYICQKFSKTRRFVCGVLKIFASREYVNYTARMRGMRDVLLEAPIRI